MPRTLPAAITTYRAGTTYKPVWVVELAEADGTFIAAYCSNVLQITDWAGSGNHALGYLSGISPIQRAIDIEGGCSLMTTVDVEIADDGSLTAALRAAVGCNVTVYFTLADGGTAKADSVVMYPGHYDSPEVRWGKFVLHLGDRREKRYPDTVLSKCIVANTTNLCGYGLARADEDTWDTSGRVYKEEWIPERSKGEDIPICFNRVEKAKGLFVSNWPGAEDLDDETDGIELRGPLWLFSDKRLTYGEDNGEVQILGSVYHFVSGKKLYLPLAEDTRFGSIQKGFFEDAPNGEIMAVCARLEDDDDHSLCRTGSVAFNLRVQPRRVEVWSGWFGPRLIIKDGVIDTDDGVTLEAPDHTGPGIGEVIEILMGDSPIGQGPDIRAMYVECACEITGETLPASTYLSMRLETTGDWGGYEFDLIQMLTPTQSYFDNVEGSDAATNTWDDAEIMNGASNPFMIGAAVGPRDISQLAQYGWLNIGIVGPSHTFTGSFTLYLARLICTVDILLEDIVMCADVRRSFDGTTHGKSATVACDAHETISATLVDLLGVAYADLYGADYPPDWSALVPSGSMHETNRLDFQLQEDMTGRDLLDMMARQASLWMVTDENGREKPLFFNRHHGAAVGTDSRQDADFDQDNIKSESVTVAQGDIEEVYTRFRVRYWKNPMDGRYEREYYADESGHNLANDSAGDTIVAWCAASQTTYGIKREKVVNADCIQDDSTAENLLISLACRRVKRPAVVTFAAPIGAACHLLEGDFPVVDHPLVEAMLEKCSGSDAVTGVGIVDSATATFVTDGVEPGDWIYLTSAALIAAGDDGWYRIQLVSSETELAIYGAPTSGLEDITYSVLPALMLTDIVSYQDRQECEIRLVEVPHDVPVAAPIAEGEGTGALAANPENLFERSEMTTAQADTVFDVTDYGADGGYDNWIVLDGAHVGSGYCYITHEQLAVDQWYTMHALCIRDDAGTVAMADAPGFGGTPTNEFGFNVHGEEPAYGGDDWETDANFTVTNVSGGLYRVSLSFKRVTAWGGSTGNYLGLGIFQYNGCPACRVTAIQVERGQTVSNYTKTTGTPITNDDESTFTDAAATFQTDGVTAGDLIYMTSAAMVTDGTAGWYTIVSVDSETQLTIDGIPGDYTGITYEIRAV